LYALQRQQTDDCSDYFACVRARAPHAAAAAAPRRQQFDAIKSLITLHPSSEASLARLAADERTTLCIVSGSERERLVEFFGSLRCWLVAENGVFIRSPELAGAPAGEGWTMSVENPHLEWLESVQHVFDYFCERTPRSFVERRETSLVWNYKYSDPEFGRLQARDLLQHLWTGPISNAAVDVIQGSKSVEVRPTGISKGVAIERTEV
jgi:trehalose 6-phosphate synthase/phosphatase